MYIYMYVNVIVKTSPATQKFTGSGCCSVKKLKPHMNLTKRMWWMRESPDGYK